MNLRGVQVGFYKAGNFSFMNREITLEEAFGLFQGDKARRSTTYIRNRFKEDIKNDFPDGNKKEYQKVKKELLDSVMLSGTLQRRTGAGEYSGLVTFDLDNNPAERLARFYRRKPDFCVAAGWSVSGAPNGFAVFYTTASNEKEYEAFSKGIKAFLEIEYGLDVPKSDHIRIRYIAYDDEMYVNYQARQAQLQEFESYIDRFYSQEAERSRIADDITESEWTEFCARYAEKHDYSFIRGQRHMYLTYFAIAANLLGINQEMCKQYITTKYSVRVDSNAISYPYSHYKESHGKWGWRLHNQNIDEYVLEPDQYVAHLNLDFRNTILFAGTGTGKTYAATTIAEKVVIAVPYHALCENIAAEYQFEQYNALSKFEGRPNKIVTTYASLGSLTRRLGNATSEYALVVDEGHNMTLSATRGFMLDDLTFIVHCLDFKVYASTTFLSGTWLYNIHPIIREMPVIRVRKPRMDKKLFYVRAKNTLQGTVDLVKKSIEEKRFPFVLQNDTSMKRDTLVGALDGIPIKSFTSRSKQDKDFLSIVQDSIIKPGISGILTTTVLKEGNNINNEFDVDVIVVGNYHSSEIEQVSQRFRKAKSIHIYIVKAADGVRTKEWGEARQFIWDEHQKASQELKTLSEIPMMEERFRKMFDIFPFRFDTGEPELDYLLISNLGLNVEKILENRNEELQIKNLRQYGIELEDRMVSGAELERTEVMEQLKEKNKKLKQDNYSSKLMEIASWVDPLKFAKKEERFESHKLQPGEDIALSYFIRIAKYHSPDVVLEYMKECEPVKNRLRKMERYFLFNAAYYVSMREGSPVKRFLQLVLEGAPELTTLPEIADHIVWAGEEVGVGTSVIKQELLKWTTGEHKQSTVFASTRALIDSMFHVKTQRKRIGGERVTAYTLKPRKQIGRPSEVDFDLVKQDFLSTINQ